MISAEVALKKLEELFPELVTVLHEDTIDGSLHLQLGVFSKFTQRAIYTRDVETFDAACKLFIELYTEGELELVKALNVSFLEHLDFGEGEPPCLWAYHAMPEKMKEAFDEMEDYNRQNS